MNKTILLTGAGGVLCGKLAEALSEKGHKIAVLDTSKEAAGAGVWITMASDLREPIQ